MAKRAGWLFIGWLIAIVSIGVVVHLTGCSDAASDQRERCLLWCDRTQRLTDIISGIDDQLASLYLVYGKSEPRQRDGMTQIIYLVTERRGMFETELADAKLNLKSLSCECSQ